MYSCSDFFVRPTMIQIRLLIYVTVNFSAAVYYFTCLDMDEGNPWAYKVDIYRAAGCNQSDFIATLENKDTCIGGCCPNSQGDAAIFTCQDSTVDDNEMFVVETVYTDMTCTESIYGYAFPRNGCVELQDPTLNREYNEDVYSYKLQLFFFFFSFFFSFSSKFS